jgi:hypothetical protein
MSRIKFSGKGTIHQSLGLSDERTTELADSMQELIESGESIAGILGRFDKMELNDHEWTCVVYHLGVIHGRQMQTQHMAEALKAEFAKKRGRK